MPGQKPDDLEPEYCREITAEANDRLEEESEDKFFTCPAFAEGPCGQDGPALSSMDVAIRPCFELRWGDGPKDQLETDDTEMLYIVASNPYSNVILKDVTIIIAEMTYQGQPVAQLPDGTPSVEITPAEFICFGDLPPGDEASNSRPEVIREMALVNRWASPGDYSLSIQYCHSVEFIQPGRDKFRFHVVSSGCRPQVNIIDVLLVILILLALILLLLLLTTYLP